MIRTSDSVAGTVTERAEGGRTDWVEGMFSGHAKAKAMNGDGGSSLQLTAITLLPGTSEGLVAWG